MSHVTTPRALKAATALAAVATAIAMSAPPAAAATSVNLGGTSRVLSVDAAGTTIDGRSPSVSRDGRYTTYSHPTAGGWQIVLHDAVTGSDTVLPGVPGYSIGAGVLSADGRFMVVDGYSAEDPAHFRVFRYNLATGSFTAMPPPDTRGRPYGIQDVTVSANGRSIAYLVSWTDNDTQEFGRADLFVSDATARTTTALGVELLGDRERYLKEPAISGDGTKVAFTTPGSLTARDTNTHDDIYVHDMATGANALASRTPSGGTGNKQSIDPQISGDGRYVAFSSRSTNLSPGVTDSSVMQAYVIDMTTFRTTMISKTAAGVAGNGWAQPVGISSSGRYVLFESAATDFGFPANPFGITSYAQLYRYDRVNDTIGLVSHAAGKKFPSNTGTVLESVISADGAHIAYTSTSRDLDRTPGIVDEYNTLDVFAWSL